MSNLIVYHDSALSGGSYVTATGVADGSSSTYLKDDRLSFKFISAGTDVTVQVDQQTDNDRSFGYLILSDHDIDGGQVEVISYPDGLRTGGTTELPSTNIPNENPYIVAMTGTLVNTQFIDVNLTASGGQTMSIGELQLSTKFTSPQRPSIGIQTDYMPRMTTVSLPNGERQTIKHAEVSRKKTYTVAGMTLAEASEWTDLFLANEGRGLIVLVDDTDDTYNCMMNSELTVNDESKTATIGLTFEEIKLS